eukprot:7383240-Prymnesium_polylepis.1
MVLQRPHLVLCGSVQHDQQRKRFGRLARRVDPGALAALLEEARRAARAAHGHVTAGSARRLKLQLEERG